MKKTKKSEPHILRKAASLSSGVLLGTQFRNVLKTGLRGVSAKAVWASAGLGLASGIGAKKGESKSSMRSAHLSGVLGGVLLPSAVVRGVAKSSSRTFLDAKVSAKKGWRLGKIKALRKNLNEVKSRSKLVSGTGMLGVRGKGDGKVIFRRIRGRLIPIKIQK